jgi:hypothetical protein
MSSIVAISFLCMVAGGVVGVEWAEASSIGLALGALAAIVFFSAIDAWECETSAAEAEESFTPVVVKPAKRPDRR